MTILGIRILLVILLIVLVVIAAFAVLIILLVRHANRQVPSPTPEPPKRPLSEILREHRTRMGMTQEYVAEAVGVSRQAVSKWESGASEPTSANLAALAELYHISAEELMAAK